MDELLESVFQGFNVSEIDSVWVRSSVIGNGSCIINNGVDALLLKALLGEDEVNVIREVSPSNLLCISTLVVRLQSIELVAAQHDLGHVQTDSKLGSCDVSLSQLVKISEEFRDSNSLFLTHNY